MLLNKLQRLAFCNGLGSLLYAALCSHPDILFQAEAALSEVVKELKCWQSLLTVEGCEDCVKSNVGSPS
jgi:hypothetical protein